MPEGAGTQGPRHGDASAAPRRHNDAREGAHPEGDAASAEPPQHGPQDTDLGGTAPDDALPAHAWPAGRAAGLPEDAPQADPRPPAAEALHAAPPVEGPAPGPDTPPPAPARQDPSEDDAPGTVPTPPAMPDDAPADPPGRAPGPPAPDPYGPPPGAFQGIDVFLGVLLSLGLTVAGTFLLLTAGDLDTFLGFSRYEEQQAANTISGLGILAAVAAHAAGHLLLARAAKRRWNMPGMAVGLIIMGSIGFLFLSLCGFLYFQFRGY